MDKIIRFIQLKNPRTQNWLKIDTRFGTIVGNSKKKTSYKNIPIYKGKDENGNPILKMPK